MVMSQPELYDFIYRYLYTHAYMYIHIYTCHMPLYLTVWRVCQITRPFLYNFLLRGALKRPKESIEPTLSEHKQTGNLPSLETSISICTCIDIDIHVHIYIYVCIHV